MIETSSDLLRSSSAIFGDLQKMFEKCSEAFVQPEQFWKIFGNLLKVVAYLRKIVKTSSLVCNYNKQNITCPLVDTNFISSCSIRSFFCAKWRELFLYLYSFRALFGRYSLPLDNKYNKLWISQTHEWLTFSLLILRHQEITSVTKHWFCLAH